MMSWDGWTEGFWLMAIYCAKCGGRVDLTEPCKTCNKKRP